MGVGAVTRHVPPCRSPPLSAPPLSASPRPSPPRPAPLHPAPLHSIPHAAMPNEASRSRVLSTEEEQTSIKAKIDAAGTGPDSDLAKERALHEENAKVRR